jgi:hypothetical protein
VKFDRAYNLRTAGQLMGGLSEREVRREIKAGNIPAKRRPTARGTGKKPRLVILASTINEYVRSLPDAGPDDVRSHDVGGRRMDPKLQAELASVPDRFDRSKGHN